MELLLKRIEKPETLDTTAHTLPFQVIKKESS
jgi:hypothetical protein